MSISKPEISSCTVIVEKMEIVKFERNKEFDRPYFDLNKQQDRYATTSQIQALRVMSSRKCESRVLYHQQTRRPKDSVAPLFSYPNFKPARSVSSSVYAFDDGYKEEISNQSREFRIRRNELSDYTERRIMFGFKFWEQFSCFDTVPTTSSVL